MATENNYIGVAMGLDVTDLKAGLSEANKQIQLANSEFKAASSGMDDWTKSAEGIRLKTTQLSTVLDLQKKKLAGLEAEYEQVVATQGENSEAARKLKVQINNQQTAINNTARELKNYETTLEGVEDGSIDLENVTLRAGRAIEKTGQQAEKAEGGFTVLKGAVATFAGNVLTSLVSGCKNAISSLFGLSQATQEYREDLGKLETAWESAGKSTELATETYKNFYSVLGEEDRSVEAVNHLAKFVDTEQDMAKWTDICTGVWGTFGDSLPIEGLTEAANETAKVGKVTGPLADALNWAGVNEDKFNESLAKCNSEQERASLITETLNGLYGEAAENYKENNASIIEARKATSDLKDTQAELGEKMEPLTTKLTEGWNKILTKILELVEGVDFNAFAATIESAFDGIVNTIIPAIVNGLKWIIDNKDILLAGIVAIGSAFAAWKVVGIVQGIVKAFKAWTLATQGQTIAQKLLNTAMKANPIGIVITLLAALVGGFITLWNTSEKFREFWKNLWEIIKNLVSKAWDGIVGIFKNVGSFFTGVVDDIKGAFSDIKDKFLEVGDNIVKGIWDGIKSGAKWLKDKIGGFAGDVAGWFKKTFKIKSPSKLIEDEVGVYVGQGVIPTSPLALSKVKKSINKFSGFVTDNLGGIKTGLSVSTSGGASGGSSDSKNAKGNTTINAGMTVNYNGSLSRKKLKQIENDNYRAIKMKLQAEGVL